MIVEESMTEDEQFEQLKMLSKYNLIVRFPTDLPGKFRMVPCSLVRLGLGTMDAFRTKYPDAVILNEVIAKGGDLGPGMPKAPSKP